MDRMKVLFFLMHVILLRFFTSSVNPFHESLEEFIFKYKSSN